MTTENWMSGTKTASKYLLAVFMGGVGTMHFVRPGFYMKIMPPYLPLHLELVYLSGVIEAALGVLLCVPRFSRLAAWGIIALLIAIFPANIYAAMTAGTPNEAMPGVSVTLAWLRLPIQPVLILWAYWYAKSGRTSQPDVVDRNPQNSSPS